jgi:hypothetical protein
MHGHNVIGALFIIAIFAFLAYGANKAGYFDRFKKGKAQGKGS